MSRHIASLIAFLTLTSAIAAQPSPSVSVHPSLAPNVFGSPSYPGWESNAIAALIASQSSNGTSTLPTYYQQIANGALVSPWLVSEFNSWLNTASPGTAFGPDFANEFGNRMYFNLHIVGNGQQFSLSQLSFQATSTDVDNFLGFSVAAGSYNYSSGFVGLNYGDDGIKNTGDDFFITAGPNTQLFDELFARGSGNANAVLNSSPGTSDQEKIDNILAAMPSAYEFQGLYTLAGDFTGSAFVVVGVPEPATIALTTTAGAALGFVCWRQLKKQRRRKRMQKKPAIA